MRWRRQIIAVSVRIRRGIARLFTVTMATLISSSSIIIIISTLTDDCHTMMVHATQQWRTDSMWSAIRALPPTCRDLASTRLIKPTIWPPPEVVICRPEAETPTAWMRDSFSGYRMLSADIYRDGPANGCPQHRIRRITNKVLLFTSYLNCLG